MRKLSQIIMVSLVLIALTWWGFQQGQSPNPVNAQPSVQTVIANAALDQNNNMTPICRFGVNGGVGGYDVASLRVGWYIDYQASANPSRPNGADYTPVIRLEQIGANDYSYSPSGTRLIEAINANPGVVWLIGNEPDRRDVQDGVEPHVYAAAYHELYALIKSHDPTARIFAGNIVQPTPIRLQYLDMILDSYQSAYGEAMPVDGWSIHNFLLNEVSCDCDEANCWGAEIPPGIDACVGVVVEVDDNDNLAIFQERIRDFRVWMEENGYRKVPLYVTEYGILMPQEYGYPSSRVNAFMNGTFDYMITAQDAAIGYEADKNRLVQKWSWYSVSDRGFNGWLFDPATKQLTDMGSNYQNYTSALQNEVDVLLANVGTDPAVLYSSGEAVTVTLRADVANIGYLTQKTGSLGVRFYNGDPNMGGAQIGAEQFVSVGGGETAVVSVSWPNIAPGAYPIYVEVDTAPGECYLVNNMATYTVLVATERVFLPITQR